MHASQQLFLLGPGPHQVGPVHPKNAQRANTYQKIIDFIPDQSDAGLRGFSPNQPHKWLLIVIKGDLYRCQLQCS